MDYWDGREGEGFVIMVGHMEKVQLQKINNFRKYKWLGRGKRQTTAARSSIFPLIHFHVSIHRASISSWQTEPSVSSRLSVIFINRALFLSRLYFFHPLYPSSGGISAAGGGARLPIMLPICHTRFAIPLLTSAIQCTAIVPVAVVVTAAGKTANASFVTDRNQ